MISVITPAYNAEPYIKQSLEWFKEEMKEGKCYDTCPQRATYKIVIEVLKKAVKADE